MRTSHGHRRKPVAAALALLGMAFYVLIFPWHAVSGVDRTLSEKAAAELASLHVYCLIDATPDNTTAPAPDEDRGTTCPLCQGNAPFSFALPVPALPLACAPSRTARFDPPAEIAATPATRIVPNSRGPPRA